MFRLLVPTLVPRVRFAFVFSTKHLKFPNNQLQPVESSLVFSCLSKTHQSSHISHTPTFKFQGLGSGGRNMFFNNMVSTKSITGVILACILLKLAKRCKPYFQKENLKKLLLLGGMCFQFSCLLRIVFLLTTSSFLLRPIILG